jgi:uncharacterized protein YebE (UPF0316 family)
MILITAMVKVTINVVRWITRMCKFMYFSSVVTMFEVMYE